ncbi:MAG: cytochrome c [Anaerolineales bacterium]|nr:MAG: cytochrome c [Anaerolineales bacterium]
MKKVMFAVFVLAALMVAACGDGGSSSAPAEIPAVPSDYAGLTNPLGADAASAGASVYKTNCESCHGPQGHGDGPAGLALDPAPQNLPELTAQVGDDFLFWRISTGVDGTSMVAWKGILTDEQIWQTVAYIRTLR